MYPNIKCSNCESIFEDGNSVVIVRGVGLYHEISGHLGAPGKSCYDIAHPDFEERHCKHTSFTGTFYMGKVYAEQEFMEATNNAEGLSLRINEKGNGDVVIGNLKGLSEVCHVFDESELIKISDAA